MKRKLIYIVTVLICCICTVCAASENENETSEVALLLDSITESSLFQKDDKPVNRDEFVNAVTRAFRLYDFTAENPYSDVDQTNEYYTAVMTALSCGLISDGEMFYPETEISLNEAAKILVCAMGMERTAAQGGYPEGYISAAANAGLFDGVSEKLTHMQAYKMIYNALMSNQSIGNDKGFHIKEESYLCGIYGIYTIKGVVSETNLSGLTAGHIITDNPYIDIKGTRIYSDEDYSSMIGKNCKAYYYYGEENKLACIVEEQNTIVTTILEDFEKIEQCKLYYWENSKEKSYNLDGGYKVIYNGRPVRQADTYPQGIDGMAELVDNNRDGKYDVIKIEEWQHMRIGSINSINLQLNDVENVENRIDAGGGDCRCKISSGNGEEILFRDLKVGDVISYKKSEDNLLVEIIRCDEYISGKIEDISSDKHSVIINGRQYRVSEYMRKNFGDEMITGSMGYFVADFKDRLISFTKNSNEIEYGYLKGCFYDSNQEKVYMTVFGQNGKFTKTTLADKVTVDSISYRSKAEAAYKKIIDAEMPQLIRYKFDKNGEINIVDTAETFSGAAYEKIESGNNTLVKNDFSRTSFPYYAGSRGCPPYFNMYKTVIFKIPTDASIEEEYSIAKVSEFYTSHAAYTFQPYDVAENGTAGAVVWRTSETSSLDENDVSCMIDGVWQEANDDGESGTGLSLWHDGIYEQYFLPDEKYPKKKSGQPLLKGDIVRVRADKNNRIVTLDVEMDVYEYLHTGSAELTSTNALYVKGGVYRSDDVYAIVSDVKNEDGSYDFSQTNLKNYCINCQYVIKLCTDTNEVIALKSEEIKPYSRFLDDADFIIIRHNQYSPKAIFVYGIK